MLALIGTRLIFVKLENNALFVVSVCPITLLFGWGNTFTYRIDVSSVLIGYICHRGAFKSAGQHLTER